jgi:formylglycine-generating enzyme
VRMGGGYQFAIKDYYMVMLGNDDVYAAMNQGQTVIGEVPAQNNPERQVTITDFFLAETEVTNAQYRDFLIDSLLTPEAAAVLRLKLKSPKAGETAGVYTTWAPLVARAGAAALLPDTACWATDFTFAFNGPLVKHYLFHPAFDPYPVVGVSWLQAKAYCSWLTTKVNAQRATKSLAPLPAYRLPTETEWEFAAREYEVKNDRSLYAYNFPWKGESVLDDKGQFRANIKTGPSDYIGDNYEYTAPAKAFQPNSKGLYQMAGNVAEWCEDVFRVNGLPNEGEQVLPSRIRLFEAADQSLKVESRVVKGGSWAEMYYAAMAGSRMGWPEARGGARIGFRVAMSKIDCACSKKHHCPHAVAF